MLDTNLQNVMKQKYWVAEKQNSSKLYLSELHACLYLTLAALGYLKELISFSFFKTSKECGVTSSPAQWK